MFRTFDPSPRCNDAKRSIARSMTTTDRGDDAHDAASSDDASSTDASRSLVVARRRAVTLSSGARVNRLDARARGNVRTWVLQSVYYVCTYRRSVTRHQSQDTRQTTNLSFSMTRVVGGTRSRHRRVMTQETKTKTNEIKVDGDTDAGGVGCVYTPKPSYSMMGLVRVPL